jgi:hypothetical protein
MFTNYAFANRTLYIDKFDTILGNLTAENELLVYAKSNEIETLLLYDLHSINNTYNITDVSTNGILADFIFKAKTQFGITQIGANGENTSFFTNIIDVYNNSRNNVNEKIDIYNLEFEFWRMTDKEEDQTIKTYYCNTYLTNNGLSCTNDGAFQYFISVLQTMRNLATNNSHAITTEAYVGTITAEQANTIANNLDRLRIHAYVKNANDAFNYAKQRLIDYANSKPGANVSIIYSSETDYMQDWLINNSMITAENVFTEDWLAESSSWTNTINLEGFTYFNYSENKNIVLATDTYNTYKLANLYPNPIKNTLFIESANNLKKITIYTVLGKLVIETTQTTIDVSSLKSGIYLAQVLTDKGMEVKKIIKE